MDIIIFKKAWDIFNGTYARYPMGKTIEDLHEKQAERIPDNIAVVFGNKT